MLASHVTIGEIVRILFGPLLRLASRPCYGFRLNSILSQQLLPRTSANPSFQLSSRIVAFCLEHFTSSSFFFFSLLGVLFAAAASAQAPAHPLKADLPPKDEIWYSGVINESNGNLKNLRGTAKLETTEMVITADEIDFDSDTDWAKARGHVHMEHFATGDKIDADHAEYNIRTEEGKFYAVDGTSPAKIMTSPGVLTTTNPFYFQAQWAERIKDRYILHRGFITDCKMPKPWWIFQAPVFDIVPGNRAIARHTVFRLKRVPVFYLPFFYRPLGRNPRQSGFLTPNFGHSSLYGYMYGAGYYWAVNRSYDMTGVMQDFTQRGPAFTYDFRGKPNRSTDFNFRLYDVDDLQGVPAGKTAEGTTLYQHQGGLQFELTATTNILGFTGRLDYNYLSSYLFREAFSYNFYSAIYNEIDSIGFLQRRFKGDAYTLTLAMQRTQAYEAPTLIGAPQDEVILQKLPAVEFSSRDRQIASGPFPLWFSFDSSAGALNRSEPENAYISAVPVFQSGTIGRLDVEPHVSTAFSFKGFSFQPGITFGATDYTDSYVGSSNITQYTARSACGGYPSCPPLPETTPVLAGSNLFRRYADFTLDFRLPSIERVFTPPKRLHLGEKVKHVIEAEAAYEYITGADDLQRVIRFDDTDIISNTNQLTLSLTNRLYRKDAAGNVIEFLTWKLAQARYFDPTFGGAVVAGQRTVVLPVAELTPYTFLDGPRSYSPVVSALTLSPSPFLAIEWHAEYDPVRHKMVDQTYNVNARRGKYFASVGESAIGTNPLLMPQANQLVFGGGYGNTNRKGWNVAGNIFYDILLKRSVFEYAQASYNTDCCGFSMQLRHLNFGLRNENQYLFSFSVANLGTFGSLQKQERIF